MRILHVGKYFPPVRGGLETILESVLELTAGSVENLVVAADRSSTRRVKRWPGCEVHLLRSLGEFLHTPIVPSMPFVLGRFLRRGVDVLALHFPNPMAAVAYLIARPFRGDEKLVVFYHSEVDFSGGISRIVAKAYYLFERIFLSRADRIVVSNPPMRDSSPQIPRYRGKTAIVHYALKEGWTELADDQLREMSRIRKAHGDRMVLFVGRLVSYKGLDTLLDAAGTIRGKIVLVGDGPLRRYLAGRIVGERLVDKVSLETSVQDTKPYFAACALLVLPSISRLETFGIVQIEAMAFGKPSVSSNLPTGVTYINVDGETGLTFPVGDAGSLSNAVNRLLDDGDLRSRLGENARRKVLEHYSPESVKLSLLDLYGDLCAYRIPR